MRKETALKTLIAVMLTILFVCSAQAADLFGVTVYPGAKEDAATTKFVNQQLKVAGSCFRTADPLVKVVDFYSKQQGLTKVSVDQEGAMFSKGRINVTIQNPWMDMQTGVMKNDTLLTIAKQ
jgi:hypothetical protein